MRRKKPRPQNTGDGCQYKYNLGLEDEHRCGKPFTPPAYRYCELHKESGPKQNKAITQKEGEFVEVHRQSYKSDKDYRRRNLNHQSRFHNGYTKPKLKAFIARAKTHQEELL